MMFALLRRVALPCLLLMPLATPAYSQETTGTILGALVDQTGAVLPGVKVVITSVETSRIREVVTNNAGQYPGKPSGRQLRNQLSTAEFSAVHGARDLSSRQRSIAGQWQTDRRCGGDADGDGGAARPADFRGATPDSARSPFGNCRSSPARSSNLSRSCPGCRATFARTPVSATRATSTSPSTGHAGARSTGCWMAPPTSTAGTTTRW